MAQATKQAKQTQLERRRNLAPSRPGQFLEPFGLNNLRAEMERLFDDFGFGPNLAFPSFGRFARSPFDWAPQTEIFERDNQLVVRADLPGLNKEDIDLDITDDRITIRGERKSEHEENEKGIYRSERSYGSFYRSLPLPDGVDPDKAKANFTNGVLEVTMPLTQPTSHGRKIEIK